MSEFEFKPSKIMGDSLPDDFKKELKNYMKSTSDKPNRIPKKLYHASPKVNFKSILERGLLPHETFGEIYFCEKESQVLKFIQKPCIVFSVNTNDLDPNEIFLSKDHVKTGDRNFEAYTYYKAIEPDKLNWKLYN